ncbi:MAG: LLM class flavin-dependent oxidoreductase [Candidatus Binatia bacterium]
MLWPAPALDAGFERGVWAEQAGFDDLWLPDGEGFQDPVALAAALGVATQRIRLCTGVVPVFNRPPPVLATGVIAAEERAPGRFVLGLGASTGNMVDRWYGLPFERPLTRVRETVALLRRILLGEKTDFAGLTLRSQGFRLQGLPSGPVPIYLAAMGARMLQLAGEIADGVVLNDFTPPDRLPWALEQIDIGAKRGGRRADDLEIVKRRAVVLAEDDDEVHEAVGFFRRYLAFYGSAPGYQAIMRELGYGESVEAIRAGYATRDRRRTTNAISDAMVTRICTFGSAALCQARLREDYAGGVDTVAVSPQAGDATAFARAASAFAASSFKPSS